MTKRAWVPVALEEAIAAGEEAARRAAATEIDAKLHALLARHSEFMDRDCINLYAGTNIPNPRAAALLSHSVGARPSLGYPGDKYETGMHHADRIEIIAGGLVKKLFRCRYAEIRVGSGSFANLYAYMALTRPGDTILSLPPEAAGHVTHHAAGAAGLYGLNVEHIPWDADEMAVDLPRLRAKAEAVRPKLLVVGGSMNLFPHPVAAIREIADDLGAKVMYDAAHMAGLVAGGCFQQPLAEGAHLMTMSTYKSFGGPSSGLVLTDDPAIAERLDRIAYPGLTANFDLGRTAALVLAVLDLLEHGAAYADAMIRNAAALARSLLKRGLPVRCRRDGTPTLSHHVAVAAAAFHGGMRASRALEQGNILASGIGIPGPAVAGDYNAIRLGTQEVTRWGMTEQDMDEIARAIADLLTGAQPAEAVRGRVIAFRRRFATLSFVRP